MSRLHIARMAGVAACLSIALTAAGAQDSDDNPIIQIPAGAETLEGTPSVRVDSDEDYSTRRVLTQEEAEAQQLRVRVIDGQFYWSSRNEHLLKMERSGDFVYLSSDPGSYIRLTRVNDRLMYVEHVDFASHSVTWWGELRIVIGK